MAFRTLFLAAMLSACAGCQGKKSEQRPLRMGYFPNLTHAQALVGDLEGAFRKELGGRFETKRFNAGPSEVEALFAGELDAGYIGSGPAINAYVRTHGALKVIAGAAAGGAVLVVRTAQRPQDLRQKKVASPQLGNTQDIALRHWLLANGLKPSGPGGGDVTIVPIPNADILSLFLRKEIEAAWVPEPWGARLVAEGGGRVLVDERDLWEGGQFPTTLVIASARALKERRGELKALLRAHVRLSQEAQAKKLAFAKRANEAFAQITGYRLAPPVLSDAVSRLDFTVDPLESQLATAAQHAAQLGFVPSSDVSGLVDRTLLDEVLRELESERGIGGAGGR